MSNSIMRATIAATCWALLLPAAAADTNSVFESAQSHMKTADAALRQKDYSAAARDYERAWHEFEQADAEKSNKDASRNAKRCHNQMVYCLNEPIMIDVRAAEELGRKGQLKESTKMFVALARRYKHLAEKYDESVLRTNLKYCANQAGMFPIQFADKARKKVTV